MTRLSTRLRASWLAIPGLLLSSAAPAFAQQVAAQTGDSRAASPIFQLEAVTVTATRTANSGFDVPASVSTVGREQLDDAQANTLSTVLRTLPNVNFGGGPRPASQSPAIRGLLGPRVILSVDGARRNNDGGVNTPLLLDPDFIKQVDVVRGPVSAAYGSGGLGGVMAFETIGVEDVLAPGKTVGGRIKAGYRSANGEASTNLTGAARTQGVDLLASVTYRDYNTIHTGAGHTGTGGSGSTLPNDGQLKSALVKSTITPNEQNRFQLGYQKFADDLTGPNNPGGNTLFPFSQKLKRRQEQYNAAWAFQDADKRLLDGKLSAYYTKFKLDSESRVVPALDPTSAMTATFGASLQNSTSFETASWMKHRVTYGLDFYRDTAKNQSAGSPNSVLPDGALQAFGGFIQDEIRILNDWTLTGALRQDSYRLSPSGQASSSNDRLSPKIALKYQPWSFLGVYASYGEAFRAPTLTEMFGNLNTTRALFNFRPNPSLKPETSKTKEAGLTLAFDDLLAKGDSLRAKATIFTEDVKDLISQQTIGTYRRVAPFSGTGLIFQQRNVANAERWGGEAEIAYTLDDLTLGLAYSRLRAKDSATGANLYAPPDKASLGVQYRLGDNWTLRYVGQAAAAQHYDSTALRRRDAYVTHDVGVAYDRDWYRVDLGVTNLFDKAYVTYQQSQADTYSYEEGRSVNMTFTARF
ncbi:TonB-dependent hemoglobin/transferrin/lactoferrin family receptor [Azospirillum cavernae]|uniref:TonB-dependent hemoglobin/transferrin/lactoferrin family receptor n=1 Tax=Azospirillum cavernae TaxID=2320860 RepID=UPI001EE4F447|nr:TonB-dependent hemoglobin/transferrin/lactoferrin family receptor [Azospirillum cavernae]